MQLRPELQISTMITALSDVIIPAIDPNNRLAAEQAQLVLGMLGLMATQLPVQFRFDRDELTRLCAAAKEMRPHLAGDAASLQALDRTASIGADVLARCQGSPDELLRAIRELRREIGAAVTAASAEGATFTPVERIVLAMSREQNLRDRALLVAQNWETGQDALPPLATLLPED